MLILSTTAVLLTLCFVHAYSYDLGTVEAIISNGAPLGTSAIETAEQRIGAVSHAAAYSSLHMHTSSMFDVIMACLHTPQYSTGCALCA
jgi:hypothetical protein